MSFYNQSEFDIRCEWGIKGVTELAPISDAIIIVDILSFSTCVDIATSRGAIVFPHHLQDEKVREFATSIDAELAVRRDRLGLDGRYSLSPNSLSQIPPQTRLVLPSPNGSTLSLMTGTTPTLVGCFRNSRAVAEIASRYGRSIAVIPAGEKWQDGTLRPAWEDWIGAGAILSHLQGNFSPEAESAIAAFDRAAPKLSYLLHQCGSGRELIGKGFALDIDLAADLNISDVAPLLRNSRWYEATDREE